MACSKEYDAGKHARTFRMHTRARKSAGAVWGNWMWASILVVGDGYTVVENWSPVHVSSQKAIDVRTHFKYKDIVHYLFHPLAPVVLFAE